MAKPPLERGNNFKRERYQQLLDAGFPKEWLDELTLHHPALYENPKAKIEGLRQRGFDNPVKLITTLPAILGLAFENVDNKIEGLRQRGFDNPHKLITSSPAILGYGFENIDAKIEGLRQRGFDNPHKLITSSPQILGYGFENIDRKIRLLYLLHGDRAKAIGELEAFPPLIGYKWRRLLFAVRTSHADGLRKLITISPRLLAAAKGKTGSDSPSQLA
jgi:mTERF